MERFWRLVRLVAPAAAVTCSAMLIGGAGRSVAASSGPCTGTINGVDVADLSTSDPDAAIDVASDGTITVEVTSSIPMTTYRIELEYAGIRWTIAEGEANGTSWTRTVGVADYTRFGVGLYRVSAISDGEASCEGSALIDVTGSPFGTVAGWVAAVMVAVGIAAVGTAAFGKRSRRVPVVGAGLGLIGGVGVVVLLQQFGVVYPTPLTMIVGAVVGAALPIVAHLISNAARPPQPVSPAEPVAHDPLVHQPVTHEPGALAPPGTQHAPQPLQPPQGTHAPVSPELTGWIGERVVGPGGLQTWPSPDTAAFPGHMLSPGVEFRIGQTVGERVLVQCSNGWTGWVGAVALSTLGHRVGNDEASTN